MKAIVWICIVGAVFWWMAISSSSREAVYLGSYYFVARIASAIGLPPPRLTPPPARPDPRPPRRKERSRVGASKDDEQTKKQPSDPEAPNRTPPADSVP